MNINLSPLVSNTGFGNGDTIDVRGNALSATSLNTHIPALQRRGVEVRFGDAAAPSMTAYAIPVATELLENYPNPFNPETWIPYHLAEDADVSLTIYDINGGVVRRLDFGYQPAGYYTDRAKAVYWDGPNNLGEPVGSGVYFYQLQTGDYSAMRKLVILK